MRIRINYSTLRANTRINTICGFKTRSNCHRVFFYFIHAITFSWRDLMFLEYAPRLRSAIISATVVNAVDRPRSVGETRRGARVGELGRVERIEGSGGVQYATIESSGVKGGGREGTWAGSGSAEIEGEVHSVEGVRSGKEGSICEGVRGWGRGSDGRGRRRSASW
ncbi:hypothetical protein Tco_1254630 [Tanacetum coccineum]